MILLFLSNLIYFSFEATLTVKIALPDTVAANEKLVATAKVDETALDADVTFAWVKVATDGGDDQSLSGTGTLGNEYVLTAGDLGSTIKVTAQYEGNDDTVSPKTVTDQVNVPSSGSQTKAFTVKIALPDTVAANEKLVATAKVDETALDADVTFAWVKVATDGGDDQPLSGTGTLGNEYVLTAGDLGSTIKVTAQYEGNDDTVSPKTVTDQVNVPSSGSQTKAFTVKIALPDTVAANEKLVATAKVDETALDADVTFAWVKVATDGGDDQPLSGTGTLGNEYVLTAGDLGSTIKVTAQYEGNDDTVSPKTVTDQVNVPSSGSQTKAFTVKIALPDTVAANEKLVATAKVDETALDADVTFAWVKVATDGGDDQPLSGTGTLGNEYVLTAGDLGSTIKVTAQYEGNDDTVSPKTVTDQVNVPSSGSQTKAFTVKIALPDTVAANEKLVATAKVDETALDADVTFAWVKVATDGGDDQPLSGTGTLGNEYVLTAGDLGSTIKVTAQYEGNDDTVSPKTVTDQVNVPSSGSQTKAFTVKIALPDTVAANEKLVATAKVDETALDADVTFAWVKVATDGGDDQPLSGTGTLGNEYVLTAGDLGSTIKVTAQYEGNDDTVSPKTVTDQVNVPSSGSQTKAFTVKIALPDTVAANEKLVATAKVDETALDADVTFAWVKVATDGGDDQPLSGTGTLGNEYVLTAGDLGSTIKVTAQYEGNDDTVSPKTVTDQVNVPSSGSQTKAFTVKIALPDTVAANEKLVATAKVDETALDADVTFAWVKVATDGGDDQPLSGTGTLGNEYVLTAGDLGSTIKVTAQYEGNDDTVSPKTVTDQVNVPSSGSQTKAFTVKIALPDTVAANEKLVATAKVDETALDADVTFAWVKVATDGGDDQPLSGTGTLGNEYVLTAGDLGSTIKVTAQYEGNDDTVSPKTVTDQVNVPSSGSQTKAFTVKIALPDTVAANEKLVATAKVDETALDADVTFAWVKVATDGGDDQPLSGTGTLGNEYVLTAGDLGSTIKVTAQYEGNDDTVSPKTVTDQVNVPSSGSQTKAFTVKIALPDTVAANEKLVATAKVDETALDADVTFAWVKVATDGGDDQPLSGTGTLGNEYVLTAGDLGSTIKVTAQYEGNDDTVSPKTVTDQVNVPSSGSQTKAFTVKIALPDTVAANEKLVATAKVDETALDADVTFAWVKVATDGGDDQPLSGTGTLGNEYVLTAGDLGSTIKVTAQYEGNDDTVSPKTVTDQVNVPSSGSQTKAFTVKIALPDTVAANEKLVATAKVDETALDADVTFAWVKVATDGGDDQPLSGTGTLGNEYVLTAGDLGSTIKVTAQYEGNDDTVSPKTVTDQVNVPSSGSQTKAFTVKIALPDTVAANEKLVATAKVDETALDADVTFAWVKVATDGGDDQPLSGTGTLGNEYVLTAGDLGSTIKVTAQYEGNDDTVSPKTVTDQVNVPSSGSQTKAFTVKIALPDTVAANEKLVATAKVDETALDADVTFAWVKVATDGGDDQPLSGTGTLGNEYVLTAGDLGSTIKVTAQYEGNDDTVSPKTVTDQVNVPSSGSQTKAFTVKIALPDTVAANEKLVATAKVDETALDADVTFAWVKVATDGGDDQPLSGTGTLGNEYVLTAGDLGSTIKVTAQYEGNDDTVSPKTATDQVNVPSSGSQTKTFSVSIPETPVSVNTLVTATIKLDDNTALKDTSKFSFTWKQSEEKTTTGNQIPNSGQTNQYTLDSSLSGYYVFVEATYTGTDGAYSTTAVPSNVIGPITPICVENEETLDGCTECTKDGSQKCSKCFTAGFVPVESGEKLGKCKSPCINDETTLDGCTTCDTKSAKCSTCFTTGFIPVESGKNVGKCQTPCVEGLTEVDSCKTCDKESAKCSVCYTDTYTPAEEKENIGKCIPKPTCVENEETLDGCTECTKDNSQKCSKCFTAGFVPVESGEKLGKCKTPCVEGSEVTSCKVCSTDSAECKTCFTDGYIPDPDNLGLCKAQETPGDSSISDEGDSSISDEGDSSISDEGDSSISDEGDSSIQSEKDSSDQPGEESSDSQIAPQPPESSQETEPINPPTIECKPNYYNRNGTCVYCEYTIEKDDITGEDICKPPCSIHISNCLSCSLVQNVYYCDTCENDYKRSFDQRLCIPKTCTELVAHCTTCDSDDPTKCSVCDEAHNFKLNNAKTACECAEGYSLHTNGLCLNDVQKSCLGKDNLCLVCQDETHCATCYNHATVSSNGTCVEIENKIANCTKWEFENGQQVCTDCEGELVATIDGKSCVKFETVSCSEKIDGCANCSSLSTTVCAVCDVSRKFKRNPVLIGEEVRCTCNDGLDFLNGECIDPIPPVTPILPEKVDNLKDDIVRNETDSTQISFKENADNYDKDTLYQYDLEDRISTVTVPNAIKQFQLVVNNKNQPVTIVSTDQSDVSVKFSQEANIKVNPAQSSNLDFTGDGVLTLNPTTKVEDLTDDTLTVGTIQPTGSNIELKSDAPKLQIEKIDVYPIEGTTTTITGKDTNGGTSCKQLMLQGRSDLTVKDIDLIDDVFIGLLSSIRLDNAKFEKVKFHIKYNRQTPETIFPINIEERNGFPQFDGSIRVEKYDVGAIMTDDEELLIARFKGNKDTAYEACVNYTKHYENSEGFNNPMCYNMTENSQNYAIMKSAKSQDKGKDDDDGGLSGGAIAGIVIACVVVVAAIIALLVYFLVIKKKNQSTTSTQGDSSIAI